MSARKLEGQRKRQGSRKEEGGDDPPRRVTIHCDGACRGNPGVGGYGVVLRCDEYEKEMNGAVAETTNNRMELLAAIRGLEVLKERCGVRVVTDSQYLKKGMTEWIHAWIERGWKTAAKKPVLNRDLWERLVELCAQHSVAWEWIPGHAGHALNERCDRLANEAIDLHLEEDVRD